MLDFLAQIGEPIGISSVIDEIRYPGYATAVGLVVWGFGISSVHKKGFSLKLPSIKGLDQVANQAKKWIKKLIP